MRRFRTKGIIFLSTPHRGSELANFIERLAFLLPNANVSELKQDEPTLVELNNWFCTNFNRLDVGVRVFCEKYPTPVKRDFFGKLISKIVVDKDSATLALPEVPVTPLDADHGSICWVKDYQFRQTDQLYGNVLKFIKDTLSKDNPDESSPKVIKKYLERSSIDELTGFKVIEIRELFRGIQKKAERPTVVIQEVRNWTNGQPILTQQICRLIQELPERIPKGKEKQQITKLVQTKIIENWQDKHDNCHLETIQEQVVKRGKGTNRLLELYKQLLMQGELPYDQSLEQLELRISGLVIIDGEKLKVNNKIYESVFNLAWVEHLISELRPYETQLRAWQASNFENSYYLLSGENLIKALDWGLDRELRDEDLEFLRKSIKEDLKRVEKEKIDSEELGITKRFKKPN